MPSETDARSESPLPKRIRLLSPITDGFSSWLRSTTAGTNDDSESPASRRPPTYIQLTTDQFEALIHNRSPPSSSDPPLTTPGPTPPSKTSTRQPSYYNNAKYEDIACKPIKPLYDGSEEQLIPFLTLLDIRRKDECWRPATLCSVTNDGATTTIDLIHHFTHVTEADVLTLASARWSSPTINQDMHEIGHDTFNARLLAKLLHASITDDFHQTLINKVPR
jgi:hypothetical protein